MGNPVTRSLDGELASAYERGARAAGHSVTRLNIGEMQFDAELHQGYRVIQELEPDLKRFQELVREADHFVIIYPNWWCTMPAQLKGLFDRAWLPGFCFQFRKDTMGKRLGLWRRLMKGKSAHVIITTGTHPLLIRIVFGDFSNEIRRAILWFAGYTTRITPLGPSEHISEERFQRWLRKMEGLGEKAI